MSSNTLACVHLKGNNATVNVMKQMGIMSIIKVRKIQYLRRLMSGDKYQFFSYRIITVAQHYRKITLISAFK